MKVVLCEVCSKYMENEDVFTKIEMNYILEVFFKSVPLKYSDFSIVK